MVLIIVALNSNVISIAFRLKLSKLMLKSPPANTVALFATQLFNKILEIFFNKVTLSLVDL